MSDSLFRDDIYEGDHVVITGGSSGIGLGIAHRFASKGANLSLVARDPEKLDDAAESLREEHAVGAEGYSSDVRDYEELSDKISEAVEKFGSIDVLVCAAAGNFLATAADMSPNAFKSVVDIDLNGTFNAARASYEHLSDEGSNIVAISATHSEQAIPFQAHACAAKAGVDSLVRTLAVEWADSDVRVNAIQPGPIADTEGIERLTPDEESREPLQEALPCGRLGTKEEVGDLLLYLVSPAASYITGAVIPIDGGQGLVGPGKLIDSMT